MRRNQKRGLSRATAGIILIVAVVIVTYLGFSKAIPFRQHFEVKADFATSNNLRKNSFVRIAGINVGKVTKIEPIREGEPGVRVTMRIDKNGRPIHKDATLSIRPRIFLEGNFFVELKPGTPSSPTVGDGDVISARQTTTPVQIDQILTSLQSDTREDLKRLLAELSTAFAGKGGIGFNRSLQYAEPAFRDSAIVAEALLGENPGDLASYIKHGGIVAGALNRNPDALKSLLTDFNTTAAAFAREQVALEQTVAELPRTLRAATPALRELNGSFPAVRRLVVDLRPAVRSSGPTLDASLPFIRQVRGLVGPAELRGLVADLRPIVPNLTRLATDSVPLYEQVRAASSCQNEVVLPWTHDRVGDPNFPPQGEVYEESVKGLPGLAQESRSGDANGQWARVLAGNGVFTYVIGSQPGGNVLGNTNFPLQGVNPPKSPLPPHRYDVPCETQEKPNLDTRIGPAPQRVQQAAVPAPMAALSDARKWEGVATIMMRDGKRALAQRYFARAQGIRRRNGLIGKAFDIVGGRLRIVDARALERKPADKLTKAQEFAVKQQRAQDAKAAQAGAKPAAAEAGAP